jgi:hypothetical protein
VEGGEEGQCNGEVEVDEIAEKIDEVSEPISP